MRRILIIGAGTLQIPVIKIARDLGYETVAVDRNPRAPGRPYADHFSTCDIFDWRGCLRVANNYGVDGIAAVAIDAEDTAARVAAVLGLPGPPQEGAILTRNKYSFYEALRGTNIPIPAFHSPVSPTDFPHFPPPWIVRPNDNSASRGASIVHEKRHFEAAYLKARSAAIHGGRVLVNELLPEGREFSSEMIFAQGVPVYLNTCFRPFWPRTLGNGIEIGNVSPAPLTNKEQEILFDLLRGVARALGVRWGVVKIDTLWPEGSPTPFVLEATLRLSGACDSTSTFPLVYGRSSVRAFLRLAMSEDVAPDDPDLVGPPVQCAAAVGFTLPRGEISQVPDFPVLAARLGVAEIVSRAEPGDVVGALQDCGGRAGFVIATGETWERAWIRGLEIAVLVPNFFEYRKQFPEEGK